MSALLRIEMEQLEQAALKKGLVMDYIRNLPWEEPNIVFWDKRQGRKQDGVWTVDECEHNPRYTAYRNGFTGQGFTREEAERFVKEFKK